MPIAHISIAAGRDPEKVARMGEAVSRALIETLDAPPDTVKVIITEVPRDRWFSAGVSLAERGKSDKP